MQAPAEQVGKVREAPKRDRAAARLGSSVEIRRFHNAVLDQGALSRPVLVRQLDAWIEAQSKA